MAKCRQNCFNISPECTCELMYALVQQAWLHVCAANYNSWNQLRASQTKPTTVCCLLLIRTSTQIFDAFIPYSYTVVLQFIYMNVTTLHYIKKKGGGILGTTPQSEEAFLCGYICHILLTVKSILLALISMYIIQRKFLKCC